MLKLLSQQRALDRMGDALGGALSAVLGGEGATSRAIRNLLHGVWLGHPLHPIMTDVALGSWTAAVVLDLLGDHQNDDPMARGADAAVGLGLLGALGSAVTGAADWRHTSGTPRRLGTAHGLLNAGATLLMGASLAARISGSRGGGRLLAMSGFGLATTAAYIGGDLVFRHKVGVNHVPEVEVRDEFTPAIAEADLKDGQPTLVRVNDYRIVLVRQGARVHALAEVCSHAGGPLSEGKIDEGGIVCPWHQSRFALEDGRVLDGPATFPQARFETRQRNGQIEVRSQADARSA